ncbi:MAG: DUF2997 domain-containing protein [Cyanobacteria bacterium P01_F01_bin.86]
METLEFIIYPDGRVKEMVTGVVGTSCEEVTRKIEEELGNVVAREATSEFYQQSVQQSAVIETQAKVSYSDWG